MGGRHIFVCGKTRQQITFYSRVARSLIMSTKIRISKMLVPETPFFNTFVISSPLQNKFDKYLYQSPDCIPA